MTENERKVHRKMWVGFCLKKVEFLYAEVSF